MASLMSGGLCWLLAVIPWFFLLWLLHPPVGQLGLELHDDLKIPRTAKDQSPVHKHFSNCWKMCVNVLLVKENHTVKMEVGI